jgi:flagellar biosynthesis protein FlhA
MKTENYEKIGKAENTASRRAGIAVLVLVFAGITFISPMILDILIAVNFLLALLVFLATVLAGKQNRRNILPAALLVCTIFGVMVHINSARLIVIKGTEFDSIMIGFISGLVKAGGNTGIIITFFIFIVAAIFIITFIIKGSTRIADAARFALDTLPGKKMAIDCEYDNGKISKEEYRSRITGLRTECDFLGSLDGADRFITGAAKLSIGIIAAVALGGIISGTTLQGQTIWESAETYIPFAVCEGFFFLLPLLLLSIAVSITVSYLTSNKQGLRKDIEG